jgi:MoaA/NifB/PqqE/SkfB family radical SAM enzyme
MLILTTNEIAKKAGAINFTGGEPFLVPQLPSLLKISTHYGVDNIITSNGLTLNVQGAHNILDAIQDDLYMLKVGMMGARAETNDLIRGSGNFDVCTKALDVMSGHDFVSCIKVSLTQHNMYEVDKFCELALKHNADQIVFGQLVSVGRAKSRLKNFMLSQDDMRRVNDAITTVKEKYWGAIKIARHCTLSGLCQESGHFYTVTPRGAVSPCLMREDLAIGSIFDDDILSKVDMLRNKVKTHQSVKDLQEGVRYADRI